MRNERRGYLGHPSFRHWNAALWVMNTEYLYRVARNLDIEYFVSVTRGWVTGDGVRMTDQLCRYAWKLCQD